MTSRPGSTPGLCSPAREERTSTCGTSAAANGIPRLTPPAFHRVGSTTSVPRSLRRALAAGVSVFELARIMGTSVRMIERHYGALLQGSGDAIRGKLDAYLDRSGQEMATASDGE